MVKLKYLLASSLLFTSIFGVSAVYAADVKIGVIDVQQIMQKSPEVQQLNTQIQQKFKPRQDKLLAAKKDLQDAIQNYQKNQAVMKPEEKTKLQNKIIGDQDAYKAQYQAFDKDLKQEQNKDMQHFMDNLQTAVNALAKKGNYNFILNRAAVPYMDSSTDVTQQILDTMNRS